MCTTLPSSATTIALLVPEKNHLIGETLKSVGIAVFLTRLGDRPRPNRQFELVGTGDLSAGQCKPPPASEANLQRLMLAHNPDSKEVISDEPWDLMLCGHTHGGQLRVPLVGEPFAPVEDKRYVAGLNAFGERHIYTTRGVGGLLWFRLKLPPGSNDAGTGVEREFYHHNKAGNFLIFAP